MKFCLLSSGCREQLIPTCLVSKNLSIFSSRKKISMTEGKEEKSTSFTLLHKILSSLSKELRTTASKLPPLGAENLVESKWAWWMAGGKLKGEQWEVHLDQQGPTKFTTLLGAHHETRLSGCRAQFRVSAGSRLSPSLLAETNMDSLEVVSFFRLLLAQFAWFFLLLVIFLLCVFPENSPLVTRQTCTGPVYRNLLNN